MVLVPPTSQTFSIPCTRPARVISTTRPMRATDPCWRGRPMSPLVATPVHPARPVKVSPVCDRLDTTDRRSDHGLVHAASRKTPLPRHGSCPKAADQRGWTPVSSDAGTSVRLRISAGTSVRISASVARRPDRALIGRHIRARGAVTGPASVEVSPADRTASSRTGQGQRKSDSSYKLQISPSRATDCKVSTRNESAHWSL